MIDVSVIIVNYKMKDHVRESLLTLFSNIKEATISIKAVVIDNDSHDGVGEMLAKEFPQVVFLHNGANIGFGAANNNAIKAVPAKYYFLLNPDTRFVEPKTIERLYMFMESNSRVGICAPRLNNFDGKIQNSCYRFPSILIPFYRRTVLGSSAIGKRELNEFLMCEWEHNKRRMVDWVMGSAMFIRATALADVGFMDDRFFMYFEDTDLCRRFWLKHWPIYYLADISLLHEHHRASADLSVIQGFFQRKTTRYHIASWLKYLGKYGLHKF